VLSILEEHLRSREPLVAGRQLVMKNDGAVTPLAGASFTHDRGTRAVEETRRDSSCPDTRCKHNHTEQSKKTRRTFRPRGFRNKPLAAMGKSLCKKPSGFTKVEGKTSRSKRNRRKKPPCCESAHRPCRESVEQGTNRRLCRQS